MNIESLGYDISSRGKAAWLLLLLVKQTGSLAFKDILSIVWRGGVSGAVEQPISVARFPSLLHAGTQARSELGKL